MCNKLYFVSSNKFKANEISKLISKISEDQIKADHIEKSLTEIQDYDIINVVRAKATEAYKKIGHPIIVDHTAVEVEAHAGLPGALTGVFWEKLKGEGFLKLFAAQPTKVTVVTAIGYCDGKHVKVFTGEQEGHFSDSVRGKSDFQWDTIFVPNGEDKTFAELGDDKEKHSMRKIALSKLVDFLKGEDEK